jgi:hypothetical protein
MFKLVLATILGILTTLAIYSVSNIALAQEEPQGEWSKHEVEAYMWHKLWERYSSCNVNTCYTDDPVLRAITYKDLASDLRPSFANLILKADLFTSAYLVLLCQFQENRLSSSQKGGVPWMSMPVLTRCPSFRGS